MTEMPKFDDWVKARGGFSIDAVFHQLLENVRNDVASWKALHTGSQNEQIEVLPYPESFAVRRESYRFGRTEARSVIFRRQTAAIEVEHQMAAQQNTIVAVVAPVLEPSGRWHFVATAGDSTRRFQEWEVRRDALEVLLFDSRVTWAEPPSKEGWA